MLAKASAHSTSPQADPPLSRAKLAPTKDCRCPQHLDSTPNPVGASLLAKAPAHPTSPQADPPLSRASSAPTGICGERRPPDHPGPPVGASLLAKTAAHSTSMQADPPLSRASSLPQWIAGALSIRIQHQTLWERACSRRRRHIQHHHKLTHHYREQAQLPQGFVANAGPLITPAPCGSELAREDGGHSTSMQADPPLSRASPLPQGIAAAHSIRIQHQTL